MMSNVGVKKCCCCVDLGTGVKILGFIVLLSLFEEYEYINPLRISITVITLTFFYKLLKEDCERNRQYFTLIFTLWVVFKLAYYTIYWAHTINEIGLVAEICEDMKREGHP